MNWNPQMEVPYANTGIPYGSGGGFMGFFEGITYEHVNFIFADAPYGQENLYPSMNTSLYKFGYSEPGSYSYYDYCHAYVVNDHMGLEANRHIDNPSAVVDEHHETEHAQGEASHANPVDCPGSHNNARDFQVVWQDNIDPDNMTYEELLDLGESVGTQNRGLSQDLISLLPVSKFKCGFFSRKKSRCERCVICQMEYKRGDKQITLPCKHLYHAGCGSQWLSINKACPICYTEVFGGGGASK